MKKLEHQIQVYYEIAMSIGKSLDLSDMLKSAILAYLRKLNCVAGLVYRTKPSQNNSFVVEPIFTIPYKLNVEKSYPKLEKYLPPLLSEEEYNSLIEDLPLNKTINQNQFFHIFALSNFGLLVLIKSDKNFDNEIIHVLKDINDKLSQACLACVNNEALKLSEKRFKDLSELLPEMVCEIDLNGHIIFANKYALQKMGYKKSEIIKDFHFKNFFHKSEQRKAVIDFLYALKHKKIPPKDYLVTKRDGTTFPAIVYTNQIINNGIVTGIRGVMIDITERKEYEEKLKSNENYLKIINQFATSVLKHNTIDGLVWEVIHMVIDKLGFEDCIIYLVDEKTNNLIQRAAYGFKNEGDTVKDPIIIKIGGGIVGTVAKTGISELVTDTSKDSRYIVDDKSRFSELAVPIVTDGEVIGVIDTEHPEKNFYTQEHLEKLETISGLVSSRIKNVMNQEKLLLAQVSLTKLSTAIEQSPLSMFITDVNGIIEFVNPAFVEITGYLAEESIGSKANILNSGIHPESLYLELWDTIKKGEKWVGEMVNKRKNGENFWILNSISPIENDTGEIINFVAIQADISEFKKLEGELILAKENAEAANKAKSEFLANMSHEIRTPMNAILGFSEALYHKLELIKHKKMVKSILSSGNLLLALLNDILDLSKIEAGKLEISPQPIDFINILQEIKLLFSNQSKKKGIEINTIVEKDFPQGLLLDEMRIKQIVFNLVGNAIKFTHKGYIQIGASFVSTNPNIGELKLEIKDTGIGIPKSQQENIFDVFVQHSNLLTRKYGGAGLGLTITKRLVEKMNGTISVSSTEGEGSVFTIIFPDVELCGSPIRPIDTFSKAQNVVFDPALILVVDDVHSNIETVENLLDSIGLNIISASNGEIALEILKHTIPDLILLDIRMPGMDGTEVVKKIKENQKTKQIPTIAFTASVFNTDKIENSDDFDGFLYKPANRAKLIGELTRFLNHKIDSKQKSSVIKEKLWTENLHEDTINNLPDIIDILRAEFEPKWKKIKDTLVLFNIETFAAELKEMGEGYTFTYLIDYANKLIEDIDLVDLEALEIRLREFPEMINKISNFKDE
jgi:PAS domain S-box-containing protein